MRAAVLALLALSAAPARAAAPPPVEGPAPEADDYELSLLPQPL